MAGMDAGRKQPGAWGVIGGTALLAWLACGQVAAAPGNAPKGSFGELKVTDGTRSRAAPEMPAELATPSLGKRPVTQPKTAATRPDLGVAVDLPALVPDFTPPPASTLDTVTLSEPELVSHVEPEYPREALLNGTSGWVKVAFHVQQDGRVDDVSVIEAEPARIFNRAAVRAVKRWRFQASAGAGPGTRRLERIIEFQAGGR